MTTCQACGRDVDGAGDLCAQCGAYCDEMGGGLPLSPNCATPPGLADGDHEPQAGDDIVTLRLTLHDTACLLGFLLMHDEDDASLRRVMAEIRDAVSPEKFERETTR